MVRFVIGNNGGSHPAIINDGGAFGPRIRNIVANNGSR